MVNVLNTPEYHAILDAVREGRMGLKEAVAKHNALEAELTRRELVAALNVALCVLEASDGPGPQYAVERIRAALANAR